MPVCLRHADIFITTACRLSVSDLPQLHLICCKLLQTKTELPLPLLLFFPYTVPPIQRSFSLLFRPSLILCLSILFCASYALGEQRADQSGRLKQQQKKQRKGKRILCIFIWREQSNLFSFHREPKRMAMAPKVSCSHKPTPTKTRGRAGIFSQHTGNSE